ncbi:NACHT, LRR and PYD domains-containing protein 3 isoform b, partial [Reticulomyxa filosa]
RRRRRRSRSRDGNESAGNAQSQLQSQSQSHSQSQSQSQSHSNESKQPEDKGKIEKKEMVKKIQLRHKKEWLNHKDMKSIGRVLACNDCIALIDLSYCNINNYEIRLLCAGLVQNRSVKDLVLVGNNIGVLGCQYLGYVLQFNHTLQSLWLRGNEGVGNEGLKYIAKGLHYNCTLQKLSLDGCGIAYNPSFADIYKEFRQDFTNKNFPKTSRLARVELSPVMKNRNTSKRQTTRSFEDQKTSVNDDDCDVLSRDLEEWSEERNCKVLNTNIKNTIADLDDMYDGVIALAHLMFLDDPNIALEIISLRNNHVTDAMACILFDGLRQNSSIQQFHLSYNALTNESVHYLTKIMNCSPKYPESTLDKSVIVLKCLAVILFYVILYFEKGCFQKFNYLARLDFVSFQKMKLLFIWSFTFLNSHSSNFLLRANKKPIGMSINFWINEKKKTFERKNKMIEYQANISQIGQRL